MTRALVVVLFGVVGASAGCGADTPSQPASSRFESVAAAEGDVDQVLHDVCDVAHPAASAPSWEWPATTSAPERPERTWIWVNFWATWCHPCIEEMPLLQRSLAGSPIALSFVSADASDEDLARYRREHAFTETSPRLTDPSGIAPVLARVGFRGVSSLPVHVLVDPQQRVRCVRAGLVEARHLERILGALGHAAGSRIR